MKQFVAWRLRSLLAAGSRWRPPRSETNRVLAILAGGIGDKLMDLPAVQYLRQEFPEKELTLVVIGAVPPFFAAQADHLIQVDVKKPSLLHRTALRGFDTVFVNSIGVFDVHCELAAFLSGSRDLRGPRFANVSERRTVYTRSYIFDQGHETVINLRGAGGHTTEDRVPYRLTFPDDPLPPGTIPPDVIFHPGSSATGLTNRWPAEHYASLAQALHKAGYSVLAIGTPGEAALLAELQTLSHGALQTRTDLGMESLARLLARARLVVANDSGIGHLAAAVGAPLITIMGANRPEKVAPVGPLVTIIGPRCEFGGCYNNPAIPQCLLCIKRIAPEEVVPVALTKLIT